MRNFLSVLTVTWMIMFASLPAIQAQGFVEVTSELGLTGTPSMRISIADLNGDDYPDIFVHDDTDWGTWDVMNRMYIFLNVPGRNSGNKTICRFYR